MERGKEIKTFRRKVEYYFTNTCVLGLRQSVLWSKNNISNIVHKI